MNDLTPPAEATKLQTLPVAGAFTLVPRTLEEAMQFSKLISQSELVPKDYRDKPANCLVAMQWGMELGLHPLQAIQNIAVINGRPSLWGDAMLALVRSSPLCEYVHESYLADGTAEIRTKRRGDPKEHVGTFSDEDAKIAGLLGKDGSWKTTPKRMKRMRARAFMLRDVYTDVLRGIPMAEEVMDFPQEKDVTPAKVEMPTTSDTSASGEPPQAASSTEAAKAPEGEARKVEGEVQTAAEQQSAAATKPLTEGQLRIIRAKLKNAALNDADLIAHFGKVEDLRFVQFQDIQDWIASKG